MLHVDNKLGRAFHFVDEAGHILDKKNIPYENDLRHIKNNQGELGYRSVFTVHHKNWNMVTGIDIARVDLDYARSLRHTDTLYSFGPLDTRPAPDQYFLIINPADFNAARKDFAWNASAYADFSFTIFKWLTLN